MKERLWELRFVRAAYEMALLLAAGVAWLIGRRWLAARLVMTADRHLEDDEPSAARRWAVAFVERKALSIRSGCRESEIVRWFLESAEATMARRRYLCHGLEAAAEMRFPRNPDSDSRLGNLLVLKEPRLDQGERGVLYLQYTESIGAFVALFRCDELAESYRLVVEPSTWGYRDAYFLLLRGARLETIVLAQDQRDFEVIAAKGGPLTPIRMGAGDWVDLNEFSHSVGPKEFDFVMVASWAKMKRHAVFFRALREAGLADVKVALVGYPWAGRGKEDVLRDAARYGVRNVSVFEAVPRAEVARVVSRSRVGVMLALREGANRGLYECLACGTPIVISAENRGVNRDIVNESTGYLANDSELAEVLKLALQRAPMLEPRAWAEKHVGYLNSWKRLDDALRACATASAEPYQLAIAKIRSAPRICYVDVSDQKRLRTATRVLVGYVR